MHRVQQREQVASIRQAGERIELRELLQLTRALGDFLFELLMRIVRKRLRTRQLIRHVVEGDGERIEFLDATASPRACRLASGNLA